MFTLPRRAGMFWPFEIYQMLYKINHLHMLKNQFVLLMPSFILSLKGYNIEWPDRLKKQNTFCSSAHSLPLVNNPPIFHFFLLLSKYNTLKYKKPRRSDLDSCHRQQELQSCLWVAEWTVQSLLEFFYIFFFQIRSFSAEWRVFCCPFLSNKLAFFVT